MRKGKLFSQIFFALVWTVSCTQHPRFEDSYLTDYRYLHHVRVMKEKVRPERQQALPDSYIIVHVDAPHLNYRTAESFFGSLQRNIFFERDPQIGHAWITVSYIDQDGKRCLYEMGHSGEVGISAPKYFDEVIHRSEIGQENPVRYLYTSLSDGYLEKGGGGHIPTLSALIPISNSNMIQNWYNMTFGQDGYDFSSWSLQNHNCVTYVLAALLALNIDVQLEETKIFIPQYLSYNKKQYKLWSDPIYQNFSIITTDSLEKWLFYKIQQGKALYITHKQIKDLRKIEVN